jgi:hypothetical protein
VTLQIRNIFRLFAAVLLLANASLIAQKINTGGPKTERRPLTDAELNTILRQYGIDPNSEPGPVSCQIRDNTGTAVTKLTAMNVGSSGYWLWYSGGTVATEVVFVVLPLYSGSPMPIQAQVFLPHSDTEIVTPFGIPFWANNLTSGNWRLIVKNNLGQHAQCDFTVVPQ